MTTIFHKFYNDKTAYINPSDLIEKQVGFPEICITTFSENIIKQFVEKNKARRIADLCSANGILPVYEIKYKNHKIGLFLSRVGAPACVAGLEEVIALGAKKIIQFGCCGVLNQKIVGNKIVIPSSAIRDEGTSYHYIAESDEISMETSSIKVLADYLEKHKIPYIIGKTWTTDGIYRETRAQIEERKKEGALVVEMECSASFAVAKFRNISMIQFLYGADNLDSEEWEARDLTDYGANASDRYMEIALGCAIKWYNIND